MNQQLKISPVDRRILERLQQDIPFVKRPWKAMAKELGIEEKFFLNRINSLKRKGIIRRISATFNPRKAGFVSTLVAVKVAPQDIDKVARRINSYGEVTHNYKRNSEYNLWFTLVARSRRRISQIIRQIKRDKEIEHVIDLPAIRLFKIEVNFPVR